MKNILLIILVSISFSLFGQSLEKCGKDDNCILTENEIIFLNEYLKGQINDFDFKDKKMLFVTGSGGSTLGTKSEYFDNIKKWKEIYNSKIATSLIILSEQDRLEYGYDAILTYWVKIIPRSNKKVLKKARERSVNQTLEV